MAIHHVKIKPQFFEGIVNGTLTGQVRENDRDYKVGDVVQFEEFDQRTTRGYTGRWWFCKITHIVYDHEIAGLGKGFVCLSLREND